MKFKLTRIEIILPFWLRWLKPFIKLNGETIYEESHFIGRHFDYIVLDEVK